MLTSLLLTSALAVGPLVDPLSGSSVGAEERERLPASGTLAAVADLWFLEMVNLRPSGAGIELADSVTLSAYGWSWTESRFLLEGVEITDPAKPGTPLIELPHFFWGEIRLTSVWARSPTLQWSLPALSHTGVRASLRGGGEGGGGTWVPQGFMDREPATFHGAGVVRRGVRRALSVDADARGPGLRLAVEHQAAELRYPTLRNLRGQLLGDPVTRTTVLAQAAWPTAQPTTRLSAVWQGTRRDYAGAEYRYPRALTAEQVANGAVVTVAQRFLDGPELRLNGTLGLGWRSDDRTPNAVAPLVRDLQGEWTRMHRPTFDERLERLRLDGVLLAEVGEREPLRLTLRFSRQSISSLAETPGGLIGTSWRRSPEPTNQSVSLDLYAPPRVAEEQLTTARLEAETERDLGGWQITLHAAADLGAIHAGPGLTMVSPAGGVAARRALAGGELFALVRHEPVPLTAQVAQFLDPARPSFRRYTWADDGDLVPEAGETGALLARFGGGANTLDPHLRRPTSSQLSLGWRSPSFGPFRAVAHGFTRVLLDRFVVRLAGPAAASYQRQELGELVGADNIDANLPVYARNPGTEGAEVYRIENARRPHPHVGAELQLVSDPGRVWFLNLMATGYWSLGCAPFGLFADRNDPGIIDPVTADPNARVNQCGSLDAGRAYHINMMAGVRPIEALDLGLALRYRDGEPMTRFVVVEDLPQGPTALMAVGRGDPVPRYTFHMTVDLRAAYRVTTGPWAIRLGVDAFNILGSGTEILEDVASGGDFRRSLEMMPGRTLMATMTGAWQ